MLNNAYVRILIVVLLALLLYYLVVTFARGVADAAPTPHSGPDVARTLGAGGELPGRR
jgi:hypothetical protein